MTRSCRPPTATRARMGRGVVAAAPEHQLSRAQPAAFFDEIPYALGARRAASRRRTTAAAPRRSPRGLRLARERNRRSDALQTPVVHPVGGGPAAAKPLQRREDRFPDLVRIRHCVTSVSVPTIVLQSSRISVMAADVRLHRMRLVAVDGRRIGRRERHRARARADRRRAQRAGAGLGALRAARAPDRQPRHRPRRRGRGRHAGDLLPAVLAHRHPAQAGGAAQLRHLVRHPDRQVGAAPPARATLADAVGDRRRSRRAADGDGRGEPLRAPPALHPARSA